MPDMVRVRFAPSPTGEPHVGNLRTALFNWLFARRYGGAFVVRVEDTDRERCVEGALTSILDSLRWLGLDWDEGPDVEGAYVPYFQSRRLEMYHKAAGQLILSDHAYRCYCSRERLEEMRRERQREKLSPGYDGHCRDLTLRERDGYAAGGTTPVVRFKMPGSGHTSLDDAIRGEVSWQNELLDDFVLLKSDGYPTYHLANVVDDHLMQISHVLRAEEWLPSTPRHLQLYHALGYEPPVFAHLPMLLGPDRAKLSKRHGATSVLEYRDAGYLPEVMVNFMALLGWSFDDKTDIMSREFLVNHFSLDRIVKSGAIFDSEKLLWMNGHYIRELGNAELAERMAPFMMRDLPNEPGGTDRNYLVRIVPLVRERLKSLADSADQTAYFFSDEIDYDTTQLLQKGMDIDSTLGALGRALEALGEVKDFNALTIEDKLRSTADGLGLSGRQLFGTLRLAVTGRTATPPLFETMEVLGKPRCLQRIDVARMKLITQKSASGSEP